MSYKAVRILIEDTIRSIDDSVMFAHARASDFNSIGSNLEKRVHLDPMKESISFSDNGSTNYSKIFNIKLVFYKLDKMEGNEKETEQILDEMDILSDKFINALNLNLVENDDLDNSEITNLSKEPVIKVTANAMSGFVVSFNFTVPDTFEYCSLYE